MFSVDLTTGVLSYDDTTYPLTAKMVNETELMVNGYGSFDGFNGFVTIEDDLMQQQDRKLHIAADIWLAIDEIGLPRLHDADIVSFNSSRDIGDPFIYGSTPVMSYSLTIADDNHKWNGINFDAANIVVWIGAEDANGDVEYQQYGRFTVDSIDMQSHKNTVTLNGVDSMGTLMLKEFDDSGISIYTIGNVALWACAQAGVQCDISGIPNPSDAAIKPVFSSPVTCRDVVGWIAQQSMRVAYIDQNGILKFSGGLNSEFYTVYKSQYITINTTVPNREYNCRLFAKKHDGTGEYTAEYAFNPGRPFYELSITLSPFKSFTQTDVDNMIATYGTILNNFSSGVLVWRGGFYVAAHAIIRAVIKYGDNRSFLAMQNRVTFENGALTYETGTDLSSLTKNKLEGIRRI